MDKLFISIGGNYYSFASDNSPLPKWEWVTDRELWIHICKKMLTYALL